MTKHIVTAKLDRRHDTFPIIDEYLAFDDFCEALRKAESLCRDILDSMGDSSYCEYDIAVHVAKDVAVTDEDNDLPLGAWDENGVRYSYDYESFDSNITNWVWYDYDEMGRDLPDMTWNIKPTQYSQGGYNYAD